MQAGDCAAFLDAALMQNITKRWTTMSELKTMKADKREVTSKGAIKQLRRDGYMPCSISQKGEDAISISLRQDELKKSIAQNGMTSVYTLKLGRKSMPVMVREIQRAPLTREWLHVTFQKISLTEETTAELPIIIIGGDTVVHNGLEVLTHLDTLPVRGLPTDFPPSVNIDVTEMEAGQQITVADLKLPEGITCELDNDRLVVGVAYPKVQAEEESDEQTDAPEGETAE